MIVVEPIKVPRTDDPKELERWYKEVVKRFSYLSDTGNPVTGGVLPRWSGDYYYESTATDWWRSTGVTAASWEQITFAAGTMGDHGTLVGLTDDDHPYLREVSTATAGDATVNWYGAAGASELRIGEAANYVGIEKDGTLEFNGDATMWDDLRVVPGSFNRPGVSDPTIVVYDVNGGGINTYLWQFDKDNIASFTVQLPHGYKQGSDIYVHIHWTPGARGNEESGATVGWKIDYSWATLNGTFGTMATADLSDACDGTDHKHQMTPEVTITGTGKTISSMLICNVKRTDTGTDDTWATNTSGNRPLLLEIDFHFELDTVASRTRTSK